MRSVIDQFRRFWRTVREDKQRRPAPHAGDSLARTIRESTQVAGAPGLGRASTTGQHGIVAEGHEHYQQSFDRHPRRKTER